jgi:mannose/fructose/N-acetylgalactosamine-specific phosphotransferase system component IID
MRRERPAVSEVSRKANVIANIVATVATLILTPVCNFLTHSKMIPMLVLSSIFYIAIFFYARIKVFDLIDG